MARLTDPQPTPVALAALDKIGTLGWLCYLEEMGKAAQEYEDSAYACDTPALAGFRARRYARAKKLREIANVLPALLAAARRGAGDTALRTSLSRNVTVALEFAARDLAVDADKNEPTRRLVEEALAECRRLLSDGAPITDDAVDVERYREALRFYADPASYRRPASKFSVYDGDWVTYPTPIESDGGVNARAALIRAHPITETD
jgi:hypothetical protein